MMAEWNGCCKGIANCSLLLAALFCYFHLGKATTPLVTTMPPTTSLPPNAMFIKYGSTLHRRNKKLDVKPFAVIPDVSALQCLSLCLQQHQASGVKSSSICRSFNFADRTCYLLNTYICDGDRELKDAPGFSYYDLSDGFSTEVDFIKSKQCEYKGRCSNKCLKFKLFKSPVSWEEAHAGCRAEEAFLAMPRNNDDHETLITLMKKGNILQSWIGVRKREGIFYYDNGSPLSNFTVWGPDQPNDSGGTQQCVQMMSEMEYMWNDFVCARPFGYICQYVWQSY